MVDIMDERTTQEVRGCREGEHAEKVEMEADDLLEQPTQRDHKPSHSMQLLYPLPKNHILFQCLNSYM